MIISGIAVWAHINEPSKERNGKDKKGKPYNIPSAYSVDLMLDGKLASKLKKEGYNIKTFKEDVPGIEGSAGKPYININKKAKFDDGNVAKPPRCVDAKKQPFAGKIGNGSKINVSVNPLEWEGFGTTGIAAKLRAVQVVELVEFGGGDDVDEFDETEGFTATTAAAASTPVVEGDDGEGDPWE